MVGAHAVADGAHVRDAVTGHEVLGAAQGEEVTELGVRAVIADPLVLGALDLAGLLVSGDLTGGPERGTLTGVVLLLGVVVVQVAGAAGGHGGGADEGFHGRGELVAEGTAGGQLDERDRGRLEAQARSDHVHVQVQADGLGVDAQLAFFIVHGEADIRLDGQVGLALGVVGAFHHHAVGAFEERRGIVALDQALLVVGVGGTGVNFDGILGHGRRGVHVGREDFEVDLHELSGLAGDLLGSGGHQGDSVTVLEHLFVAQDRTIPTVTLVGGEGDQTGDAVLALDVLGGDDAVDAFDLQGLGEVDALDVGVGHAGFDDGQVQGVGGQLQGLVVTEGPLAGDLGHAGRTRSAGIEDVAVGREVMVDVEGHLAAQDLGGVHDGVDQRDKTGAAAHVLVLLEPVAHLLAGGLGILVQQALGGHDEARGAEAALGRAVDHPGHLQRMQVLRGADAFNGGDVGVVLDPADLGDAGAHDLAVEDHRTGAALAFAATDLGPDQVHLLAQHLGQEGIGVNDELALDAVDDPDFFQLFCNFHAFAPLAG